jgi:esterase/lipase
MNKIGISLGWNCNGAIYGVQTGIRKKKEEGYLTCPFDEMVTNLSGIIKCFEEDFINFYNPDYLDLVEYKGDNLIRNKYYNFIYNHESPGHANLYITQNWKGGINHYINNNYEQFKNRYKRRIDNLLNYLNNTENYIIFILHGYTSENKNIQKLNNVLQNKFPNLKYEFFILEVHYDKTVIYEHYNLMGVSNTDDLL